MTVEVHFARVNEGFNKEYANQYHDGKESDTNQKHHWKLGWAIDQVVKVEINDSESLPLAYKNHEGEKVDFTIPNLYILHCELKDGDKVAYGLSKSLLISKYNRYYEKKNCERYYFYMKDTDAIVKMKNGLYLDKKDIPNELITTQA